MLKVLKVGNIKVSVKEELSGEDLKKLAEKKLKTKVKDVKLLKKSIDARNKSDVVYNLTLSFKAENEKNEERLLKRKDVSRASEIEYVIKKRRADFRPVVVGFGPAGFMAGLYLAEAGLKPIILERGEDADSRRAKAERFFKTGELDTNSNVQFGEGGAGTFSDGKLATGINDPRISFVLKKFAEFGAPKEILYSAKPHVGTDKLSEMVKNIRKRILELGGDVYFNKKVTEFNVKDGKLLGVYCGSELFETKACIFAVGHSARDTFEMLYNMGLPMERKGFSVGVRVEHSQEFINRAQYGDFAKYLPAADYKLAAKTEGGRGVYSFCMCPGGYVVGAASEEEGVVTNGMSNFARDGENANSALLVSVYPTDFEGDNPLEGIAFQRQLERKAFRLGGGRYFAPVQNVTDFTEGRGSKALTDIMPTYRPGVTPSDFRELFPEFIGSALRQGLSLFDRKIKGFGKSGVMTAVESRSSSPVRLIRDRESLECVGLRGLYPCGEGAGYAGGITSAAVDGLKCAEKVLGRFEGFAI